MRTFNIDYFTVIPDLSVESYGKILVAGMIAFSTEATPDKPIFIDANGTLHLEGDGIQTKHYDTQRIKLCTGIKK